MSPRTPSRRSLVALGLAIVTMLASFGPVASAVAEDGEAVPGEGPIWTSRPVRIDRGRETRERLPAIETKKVLRLRVAAFPRVGLDGSFLAGGRRWRIAHVVLPETSQVCRLDDGRRWACGARAVARFSGLLAGARLVCDPPITEDAVPALTCRLADRSVAERLIGEGWAEPDETAPDDLAAVAAEARADGRGLHAHDAPP